MQREYYLIVSPQKKKKKFPLTIYAIKDSILDAWHGSEYVFGIYTLLLTLFLAKAYCWFLLELNKIC